MRIYEVYYYEETTSYSRKVNYAITVFKWTAKRLTKRAKGCLFMQTYNVSWRSWLKTLIFGRWF